MDERVCRRSGQITRSGCLRGLLGVSLLLMSGCRGSGDEKETLRVTTIVGARMQLVTDALGLFRKEGLRVELEEAAGSAKVAQSLVGGSTDIALTVYDVAVQLA